MDMFIVSRRCKDDGSAQTCRHVWITTETMSYQNPYANADINLYHKKSPKRAPNPYRDPCPNPFSSYLHPCANAHPKSRFQSTSRSRSKSLHSPIEMFMRIPIRIPIHSLSESAIQSSTPIPLQILVHITIETPIEMIHQFLQPLFKALCRCLSKSRSEYIVYIDVYVYMCR